MTECTIFETRTPFAAFCYASTFVMQAHFTILVLLVLFDCFGTLISFDEVEILAFILLFINDTFDVADAFFDVVLIYGLFLVGILLAVEILVVAWTLVGAWTLVVAWTLVGAWTLVVAWTLVGAWTLGVVILVDDAPLLA